MRVLLLTSDAYGGHGGIALYNRDVADALAAMPEIQEVVVIPRAMPLVVDGVPNKVRFVAEASGGKFPFTFATFSALREHFDLVICGHINLLPLALLLNLCIRAPLVLMAYGIDVWQQPYCLARQWLRKVDAVWSISAITRDRMNAWAELPMSKYTLLPNAIHLERYGMAEKREDMMDRYCLTGSKVIMTLARLPGVERYKGVDEVLEIMPALLEEEPSLKYVVAGEGDDRPRLEAKAHSLGIAEKVVFTGMVKESDKADMFRLADAFVMPGRGEGFGFVFLEALACGVPAVGSKVDGSREALRDGMLGELVDPADPESIKQGILRALAKPKVIIPSLSFFDWPHFQDRLHSAVNSLTKTRRANAN